MKFKFLIALTLILVVSIVFSQKISAQIVNVSGIADVYGEGEKISVAIVEYPKILSPKAVSADDFEVDGKIIESVRVNDKPQSTKKNRRGKYVILTFKYQNEAFDGDLNQRKRPEAPKSGDAPMRSDRKLPNLAFTVKQINKITAVDGTEFLPSEKTSSEPISAPIIEKFKQFTYQDASGLEIPYNLYLPEGYTPEKKYPLLFFVADASANINEVTTPLFQGNGATIWATDSEQKKHPCIILAPQYTTDLVNSIGMMTTDENVWTQGLSLVSNLLFDVIDTYSVDKSRIYGTGQSQGGMANIAISDKYPDLFAAQLLVACQWNIDEMEALKDKNLWIVVCEGDTKAFPAMNSAVERWKELGSKVAGNETFWDSKIPVAELDKKVKSLESEHANINYTVFAGGNHMYTWSFAYNIDAIRDWLFKRRLFLEE